MHTDAETKEYIKYVVEKLKEGKTFSVGSINSFAETKGIDSFHLMDKIVEQAEEKEVKGKKFDKFKKSIKTFKARVLDEETAFIKKKGFIGESRRKPTTEYMDALAKEKGYGSYYEYMEALAKRKGHRGESGRKPTTEYMEALARSKGHRGESGRKPITEYKEALVREKGFKSAYDRDKFNKTVQFASVVASLEELGIPTEMAIKEAEKIIKLPTKKTKEKGSKLKERLKRKRSN